MQFLSHLLMIVLLLTSLVLFVLVLVQRGKGGGLAGAFGGMGGQSAFGTKAGDLFTKITIGVAAFWIVLCVIAVRFLGGAPSLIDESMGGESPDKGGFSAPASTDSDGSTPAESDAPTKKSGD